MSRFAVISILKYRGWWGLCIAIYYRMLIFFRSRIKNKQYIKRRIYNYSMYLDARDPGISRTLLLFGQREIEHRIILERVLKPGMTVLDIGANIGYYTVMESKWVGPTGRVIAVEPSFRNVDLLRRNINLNRCDNVCVFHCAISDTVGEREFFIARSSNLNTFHNTGSGARDLTGETIVVQTKTVPVMMQSIGKPDLLRMDVEGHEVEIIDGLIPSIVNREMNPMIIFETHLSRYHSKHDMALTLKRLFSCGYYVKYLASSTEAGTQRIHAQGYCGSFPIKTDFVHRVIYENVKQEDAIDFICRTGGVRTVLLVPEHC